MRLGVAEQRAGQRPRVAPSCTASRQVQRPSPSMTPVRSSSARAASMAATVVMAAPSPGSGAPGCGRWRRPSPAPQRAMVRRSSDSYQRSSAATPSAPPVASAHSDGRPISVALAPERQRLDHVGGAAHAAVDVDLGPPVDGVDDLGQDVGRGRRVGQLACPVVGHHDRGRPGVDAAHGVVGPLHALDHDGQRTQPGQPLDVVGRQRRLELVGHHGHEPALAGAVGAVARQVGQGQVVGQVHADAPLAQAEPRDGGVDGQHQGAVAVGGGAAHQVLGARPLPQDVDLHPAGARRARRRPRPRAGRWPATTGSAARRPRRRPGRVATSPSAWASPWIAVGAMATGELTGRPEQGRRGRDLGEPGQHVRVELPVAPGVHVAPAAGARRRRRPSSRRRPSPRWRGGRHARGRRGRGR